MVTGTRMALPWALPAPGEDEEVRKAAVWSTLWGCAQARCWCASAPAHLLHGSETLLVRQEHALFPCN